MDRANSHTKPYNTPFVRSHYINIKYELRAWVTCESLGKVRLRLRAFKSSNDKATLAFEIEPLLNCYGVK